MKIRIRYRDDGRIVVTALVPFGKKFLPVTATGMALPDLRAGAVATLHKVLEEVEPMRLRKRKGTDEPGGAQ